MSRRPSRNFSHASKNGTVTGIRLTKLPGTATTSRKNTIGKSCTFENESVLPRSPLESSFVVFIVDFFYFFFFTAKSSSSLLHVFLIISSFPLKRKRIRDTERETHTERDSRKRRTPSSKRATPPTRILPSPYSRFLLSKRSFYQSAMLKVKDTSEIQKTVKCEKKKHACQMRTTHYY